MKFGEVIEKKEWPTLKGSAKQITYGNFCREKLWSWHIYKQKSANQQVDKKSWNIIFSFIDDSKFFIENKDSDPQLFYMMFKEWLKKNNKEEEFTKFRKRL